MAFASYDYYRNVFRGRDLSPEDFSYYAERASDYISSLVPDPENHQGLQSACCAVADAMQKEDKGGEKTAERVGDYSVSYAAGVDSRSQDQKLREVLSRYIPIRIVRWI